METWQAMSNAWMGFASAWNDDRSLFVVLLVGSHLVAFYVINALLSVCYSYNLFPQWRIQGGKMPDRALIVKCLMHVVFNTLVVQPIAAYFLFFDLFSWAGMCVRCPLPPLSTVLWQFAVCTIVNDTMFYFVHR
jgi:sterol desaturase/sphingolipid hydroxylase (fatty acid hydroxylase superfamily)